MESNVISGIKNCFVIKPLAPRLAAIPGNIFKNNSKKNPSAKAEQSSFHFRIFFAPNNSNERIKTSVFQTTIESNGRLNGRRPFKWITSTWKWMSVSESGRHLNKFGYSILSVNWLDKIDNRQMNTPNGTTSLNRLIYVNPASIYLYDGL